MSVSLLVTDRLDVLQTCTYMYLHVHVFTSVYCTVVCIYIYIIIMYIICMQVHDGKNTELVAYRYMYTWNVLCSCMHTHDSTFALQVLAPGQ